MLQDVISTFTRMKRYKFTGETIHCDLCGSVERDIVGRRDRYGNPLQTCLCRGCGLVFTSPMPTDLEVDNFYRRFYRKSYHNAYKPTAKALLRAERGAASRCEAVRPALKPGARVLDVGSASGNFVRFMADQGYDSMGIEPPTFEQQASQIRKAIRTRYCASGKPVRHCLQEFWSHAVPAS